MERNKRGRRLTNVQAVVVAMIQLGGDHRLVDLEDVAFRANQVAPGQFRWRKYADQINLYRVRYALKDAQGAGLIRGDSRRGWQLTPLGVKEATSHQASAVVGVDSRSEREARDRRMIEKARLSELPALGKYRNGDEVSQREAQAVFRLDDYTRSNRRQELLDRMTALLGDDDDLGEFVVEMSRIVRGQ